MFLLHHNFPTFPRLLVMETNNFFFISPSPTLGFLFYCVANYPRLCSFYLLSNFLEIWNREGKLIIVKNLIPYLFIGAYLLLTLVIGIIGYRSQKDTPEDYFLAERKIGSIVLFFTLIATNFSAFAFLGLSGAGYRIGISYYPMIGFGTALVRITFYVIGYKVWLLDK